MSADATLYSLSMDTGVLRPVTFVVSGPGLVNGHSETMENCALEREFACIIIRRNRGT